MILAEPVILEAYVGLTLAVPIFVTAIVALACAFLFVITMALGVVTEVRWVYTLMLIPVVGTIFAVIGAVFRRLKRFKKPGMVIWLQTAVERSLGPEDVGEKAFRLAQMAANGLPVPTGWVLRQDAFTQTIQNAKLKPDPQDSTFAARLEGVKIPRSLLAKLHRTLLSSSYRDFLLRSSFYGEDAAGHAFPGMYESVSWHRDEGRNALRDALIKVWQSYWNERAITYRAGLNHEASPAPHLSVLVSAVIDHELSGFVSSTDIRTGFCEKHVIDIATDEHEWTGVHDILTDQLLPCSEAMSTEPALMTSLGRDLSMIAGRIEQLFGCAVEVEWGIQGNEIWLYQARPLTALSPIDTFTNSHIVDVPRYALSPLSRSLLCDEDPPSELFNGAFRNLGIPEIEPEDVRWIDGHLYVRVNTLKALITDSSAVKPPIGLSMKLLGALFGTALSGGAAALPLPERPPAPPQSPEAKPIDNLRSLKAIRTERLVPLIHAQMEATQLAAICDDLAKRLSIRGLPPAPVVNTPLKTLAETLALTEENVELDATIHNALWFLSEREAELSQPRLDEGGPALDNVRRALQASTESVNAESSQATEAKTKNGGTTWLERVAARTRDKYLTRREMLNVAINVVNHQARQTALALDAQLVSKMAGWQSGDVFQQSFSDLETLLANNDDGSGLDQAAMAERRNVFSRRSTTDAPAIKHLDAEGNTVPELATVLPDGVLAVGVPTGTGQAVGAIKVVKRDMQVDTSNLADLILVLPDPAPAWASLVMACRGVIFDRGGPLSHLAILCREREIPAVVAAAGALEKLEDGQRVKVDGTRGLVLQDA